MTYKLLFLDSDMLIDLLLKREPFSTFTQTLINESQSRKFNLNTSALVITNINYIVSKYAGALFARQSIEKVVNFINILPFESDIINLALNSDFKDFEDAVQFFIAERFKCDVIITRNIKDYKKSTIPVLTAEQFLRTL